MTEEEKKLLEKPHQPDDPDEHAEFEEWTYFENGKRVTVKRPNPKFRPDR